MYLSINTVSNQIRWFVILEDKGMIKVYVYSNIKTITKTFYDMIPLLINAEHA